MFTLFVTVNRDIAFTQRGECSMFEIGNRFWLTWFCRILNEATAGAASVFKPLWCFHCLPISRSPLPLNGFGFIWRLRHSRPSQTEKAKWLSVCFSVIQSVYSFFCWVRMLEFKIKKFVFRNRKKINKWELKKVEVVSHTEAVGKIDETMRSAEPEWLVRMFRSSVIEMNIVQLPGWHPSTYIHTL